MMLVCDDCGAGVTLEDRGNHVEAVCVQCGGRCPIHSTMAEVLAAGREVDALWEHSGTDEQHKAAAMAGPCFCEGRFKCSRCQYQERAS